MRHKYQGNDNASVCLSIESFRSEVTPSQGWYVHHEQTMLPFLLLCRNYL